MKKIDKKLQNYYTKNTDIKKYMVKRLEVQENELILEPSAGMGEFIETIVDLGRNVEIDAYDINVDDTDYLKKKYGELENIHIFNSNTLKDETLDLYSNMGGYYDKIIGNPPYGAWVDYSERRELKKLYGNLYSKETYILFLVRCVKLLKEGGKLVFIIPDTYLYLNMYKTQRRMLLTHTKLESILVFPSKFFDGVKFGYSSLSIVTLEKCDDEEACKNNTVTVLKGFNDASEFLSSGSHVTKYSTKQEDILKDPTYSLVLDDAIGEHIRMAEKTLGDLANCVTGIYTGDNKKFLALSTKKGAKNASGYKIIESDKVEVHIHSIEGISNGKEYVPLVKGSSETKYRRVQNPWLIKWSKEDILHYNNDKKARFQNSQYYFNHGIAVPMVKSKVIRATEMNGMVFDQSIVGVFPKQKKYFNFILGLLNSDYGNKLIHLINPTANNSANYLKKIPINIPTDVQLVKIDKLVNKLKEQPNNEEFQNSLNQIFEEIYK